MAQFLVDLSITACELLLQAPGQLEPPGVGRPLLTALRVIALHQPRVGAQGEGVEGGLGLGGCVVGVFCQPPH